MSDNLAVEGGSHYARPMSPCPEPQWWLIVAVALVIWCYVAALAGGLPAWVDVANVGGPLSLGAAAAISLYRLMRRFPEAIWTPYVWFLLAAVLYYSAGPLIYPLAGPSTLAYATVLLPVRAQELLRTNLLDAVGVLAVLLGILGSRRLVSSRRRARRQLSEPRVVHAKNVALTFIGVGGILQYFLILPSDFGVRFLILPGVVRNLGFLYVLGLLVLAYVVARGERRWRVPLALLWFIQIAVAVLLFSKRQLILTLILPPLGAYLGHRRLSRLALWGAVAGLVYVSAASLVLWGRARILETTGYTYRASLSTRAQIVERWFDEGMPTISSRVPATALAWNRLNYAPEQTFAMSRYDEGYPGNTLRYAPIVFIPRLFWPSKPVTTNLGPDFFALITGAHSTSLGLGIFGEGYWDYGWFGVMGLGLLTGMIFELLGRLAVPWMQCRSFEYLPSVFIGMNMGLIGTTSFFVNGILGATGFFLGYQFLAWLIVRGVRSRGYAIGASGLPTTLDSGGRLRDP